MSETFTPGPWWTDAQYLEDEFGCCIIAANTDCGPLPGNPTRGQVAFAIDILPENAPICQANARLISAAPDLYEACKEFVRKVEAGEAKSTRSYAQMKTALAKARGETE